MAKLDPPYPTPEPSAVHWRIVGTAGLLLEGYAVVDFAIIKFGFMLAAWAEAGLALEPRAPITLSIDLGVSVRTIALITGALGLVPVTLWIFAQRYWPPADDRTAYRSPAPPRAGLSAGRR